MTLKGLVGGAFKGAFNGLTNGGIGGGNILNHVAQGIQETRPASTSRAGTGTVVSPEKRPHKKQRIDASTNTGDFSNALDGGNLATEPTVAVGPNEFMGPVAPAGWTPNIVNGSGAGWNKGCSCSGRRKYTCEEKCAYNAAMQEKCKGCRSYFRKNKKWIYPKKKKRSYRKSSRRSYRNSGGLNMNQLLPFMLLR